MDYRVYLKVKIKSLAAEARIIRQEEMKHGPNREGLYLHRVGPVRAEARHTLLAYNFIRGVPFRATEAKSDTNTIELKKVQAMVKQYGQRPVSLNSRDWQVEKEDELKRLDAWFQEK